MIFGYARVSTQEQNLYRQEDELKKQGCQKVFMEKVTGTKKDRPELERMFEHLRPGDTVIVSELSRLSRSTKDIFSIVDRLEKMDVDFTSLKEGIDLKNKSAVGKMMFGMFAIFAQFERDMISDRSKAGVAAARARGRVGGRPRADKKQVEKALKLYDSKDYSMNEISSMTGISVRTIYNYINKRTEVD